MTTFVGEFSFERMEAAVEKVRSRLLRAAQSLEQSAIPYAVVGGNAVAAWVATIDEAAVRNTRDVDILLRRQDLGIATSALEAAGFIYRHVSNMDVFLDGDSASVRDAVHIVFAEERVRPEELLPNPRVSESVEADGYRVLSLHALVQIKLTAYRDKDRVHLRDLIDVGLVGPEWTSRFPASLSERLQRIIDTPDG